MRKYAAIKCDSTLVCFYQLYHSFYCFCPTSNFFLPGIWISMNNPQDNELRWPPLTRQRVDGWRVRLNDVNEAACTMGALKVFHSGIVLSIVDFKKGECLSPADILCSFHWCDLRVILFTGRRSTALGLVSRSLCSILYRVSDWTGSLWFRSRSVRLNHPKSRKRAVIEMMS
jgi:hypothetical protein